MPKARDKVLASKNRGGSAGGGHGGGRGKGKEQVAASHGGIPSKERRQLKWVAGKDDREKLAKAAPAGPGGAKGGGAGGSGRDPHEDNEVVGAYGHEYRGDVEYGMGETDATRKTDNEKGTEGMEGDEIQEDEAEGEEGGNADEDAEEGDDCSGSEEDEEEDGSGSGDNSEEEVYTGEGEEADGDKAADFVDLVDEGGEDDEGTEGQQRLTHYYPERFDKDVLQQAMVEFVVATDQAFSVVDHPTFRGMMIASNPACAEEKVIPSRSTLARQIIRLAGLAKKKLKQELLAEGSGAVALTHDIWTGANHRSYMAVTGHSNSKDFELRRVTLAFCALPGDHTGKKIAEVVEDVAKDWDLEGRCIAVTSDNASSSVAAMEFLCRGGPGDRQPPLFFSGMHVR
ncbi:unnamed protein product [Closterium sp. Naga37s-1]|nr:unnamed protein product [Closterium sp. Naga37s-1]